MNFIPPQNMNSYSNNSRLSAAELKELEEKHAAALCTTNGDTGPVEITARQLRLLLDHKAENVELRRVVDEAARCFSGPGAATWGLEVSNRLYDASERYPAADTAKSDPS